MAAEVTKGVNQVIEDQSFFQIKYDKFLKFLFLHTDLAFNNLSSQIGKLKAGWPNGILGHFVYLKLYSSYTQKTLNNLPG